MMNRNSDLKETIKLRWGKRARSYDMSPGHGIHSKQEKEAWMQILSNALNRRQGLTVLDVGTGTGALALLLAEMGHTAVGIDLSQRMLQRASEKAHARNMTVEFKIGDAEAPPFERESFDAIVSRHVLWTLPNPEHALKTWNRLLKPNGIIAIIDGNFSLKNRTVIQEAWRLMAMPLIFITEFRNPKIPRDMDKHLPMRQRRRPEADIALLEAEGLKASVSNEVLPRTYSVLNYIKYGYSKSSMHQFVAKGVKTA